MHDDQFFIFEIIVLLGVFCLFIAIIVIIIRWVLRINDIIKLLTDISTKLSPPVVPDCPDPPSNELLICDRCRQEFPRSQMIELKIGKMVCHVCNKLLNSM